MATREIHDNRSSIRTEKRYAELNLAVKWLFLAHQEYSKLSVKPEGGMKHV
jgi:hypothetical protein